MAHAPLAQPFEQFREWFEEAKAHPGIEDATAMHLATADANGQPDSRMVLLKGWDETGFTFYTNMNSTKAAQLRTNPHAALCFFWQPVYRQIRIQGDAEQVSDAEADTYFASRPRGSQIGAWASQQSQPLENRAAMEALIAELETQYEGQDIPRPPHWSGWHIIPQKIEFWQGKEHRLHVRECFTRAADGWDFTLLQP